MFADLGCVCVCEALSGIVKSICIITGVVVIDRHVQGSCLPLGASVQCLVQSLLLCCLNLLRLVVL